ncbi:hypothetical protein UFOVP1288_66 [uncultured Caudovirales phage]|uniref:Uncharacterized protein n=1 Tax=uncultured Caudovirales phage TaxID=2100421 RepID=A0A6J5RW54_9CAUD|nr:hypothetical protein UFOVP1195_66 [uncultured Caudovirales phage]CAB4196194.1 hypothetical protein UFOVP1288_66 [uncultured Caudovirales phage]CAB4205172.1 hypothetical protein UFOVP1409_66 [uncultured Caudovirales phage]
MAESRLARELETRTTTERPKQWQPAATLPEPDKQPGYSYRWVRVSTLSQADPRNISSKLREGWEPVRIEEQPQFRMMVDPSSRFKDNIEVAGLLLCKIPDAFMDQRREYFDRLTRDQIESVDNNFMKENDPRMPLFRERKSTSSFGKGK